MTQEKMKRTVIASVVAATLLVVVLLAVLIYQLVSIAVFNKRISKIEPEIADYQETIDKQEDNLDFYLSEIGKEHLLYGYGWCKKNK